MQLQSPAKDGRVQFYESLLQSKREIQSLTKIIEHITTVFKGDQTFKQKYEDVVNSLAQHWTESTTASERANIKPLVHASSTAAKEFHIELGEFHRFKAVVNEIEIEHKASDKDSDKKQSDFEKASESTFELDAFYKLVQPHYLAAKEVLQSEEVEFVQKENYEAASDKAQELMELEKTSPEYLQKMLGAQGPIDGVVFDACDSLVEKLVNANPAVAKVLEPAYKKLRLQYM